MPPVTEREVGADHDLGGCAVAPEHRSEGAARPSSCRPFAMVRARREGERGCDDEQECDRERDQKYGDVRVAPAVELEQVTDPDREAPREREREREGERPRRSPRTVRYEEPPRIPELLPGHSQGAQQVVVIFVGALVGAEQ